MNGDRKKSLFSYEKIVGNKFRKKYEYDNKIFCRQVITQIIYNQKSRIVSAFKDNLIINDSTEFLKRYYTKRESKVRLKKYFDYYEEFSKIYPNYTAIHEGKYFYLNIQRKQRLIDIQEELEYKSRINQKEQRMNKFKFFNTDVYDSIVNDQDKEEIEFLFDIEVDMTKSEREKEENEFFQKINDIITLIGDDPPNNDENIFNSNNNILLKISPVNNSSINQKKSNPSTDRTARDKFEIKYLRLLKLNQNLNNSIHNNSSSIHKNSTFIDNNNTTKTKSKKSSSVTTKQNTLVPKTRNQGALTHRTKVSNTSVDMSKPPSTERIKQKYNNIIYIINNNPKYTTQVNFYNSNYVEKNKQIVKNKNAVLNRRVNSSIGRSASRSTSNSQSKKNDFLLKTARDVGYKDIHMTKENSKPKHKKTISNVNNVFLSRNNKKGLIFGEGAKTNTIRGFVDMVNSSSVNRNKNVIKGIHIKNFNKALSQSKK